MSDFCRNSEVTTGWNTGGILRQISDTIRYGKKNMDKNPKRLSDQLVESWI